MTWNSIISFTEKNVPYRYRVTTKTAPNSILCRIDVEELDELDVKTGDFDFVYDLEQNIPLADYKLHEKPIDSLLTQMLALNDDPQTW